VNRLLWVEKPNYKNNIFKFLEKEQHCGNCANRGRNGCFSAIILKVAKGTITVQSRCSGVERTYPIFVMNFGELIKRDITNHRNWRLNGTLKGKGHCNGGTNSN